MSIVVPRPSAWSGLWENDPTLDRPDVVDGTEKQGPPKLILSMSPSPSSSVEASWASPAPIRTNGTW